MKKRNKRGLALLLTAVLLVSVGILIGWKLDRERGIRDYRDAARLVKLDPDAPIKPEGASREDAPTDPTAAELANLDLEALQEMNGDVIAWIYIPDLPLSYPVLQSADNCYYLNHTWTGARSAMGAIFMECTASPDFSDFNTILYGHRMNDASMFGVLSRYQDEDFCQSHPNIYVADDRLIRRYAVFAAHEVGVREIVYRLDLEEAGLQQELIDFCLESSAVNTGVVPTADEQVLTLSTCTGRGHATRWVVQGVLRETWPR